MRQWRWSPKRRPHPRRRCLGKPHLLEESHGDASPMEEEPGEASPMEAVSEEASPEVPDEATPRREGHRSESRTESV